MPDIKYKILVYDASDGLKFIIYLDKFINMDPSINYFEI